ncbi:MAG: Ppx/GppA phosphatase family protein [Anaerolineales bacterium]|nr:Ppx/GppA phosphatase family protein [Anaerolineales bacterium]
MYHPSRWMHRLGIIDLGSNSARLIVAQYTPGESFKITYEYSRRVRLAEGLAANERLQPAAIARAIETLQMFQAYCAANGVRRILPVATAATRDAVNRAEFLREVRQATGLRLRVLSGEQEAYYGALGVINGSGLRDGLVIDVGGGSAQISVVRDGAFQRGHATSLGAVRLTEAFFPDERVTAAQFKALNRHLDQTFAKLTWMKLNGGRFVGLGGSIRTLARIDRDQRDYPLRLLNGYELRLESIEALIERMRALPVRERARRIPGLPSDRADVMLAGAMVVAAALRRVGAETLIVSDQGLREGLLYEAFLGRGATPIIPNLRTFSVLNLARVYGYYSRHEEQVARLAVSLFDQLARRHGFGAAEREYLWAAAMLNDIGTAVNYQDHHKHSAYLILSAGLPGYSHRETALIALLCVYHRKGKADVQAYRPVLAKGDGERLRKLGAILRLAEALDSSRTQDVAEVKVRSNGQQVCLTVIGRRDVRWEAGEAQRNAELFEDAFDCKLEVRTS